MVCCSSNHMEAISQDTFHVSKIMEYTHINYWFICYFLFVVLCCLMSKLWVPQLTFWFRQKFTNYYSPTVQYFGDEHLPYAITAIVIVTLLVNIPTMILILYPFQFFQWFLSFFPLNWHFLHAFVDLFQGCYKDGTEPGTFDCWWFSVLTLLSQLLLFIIYAMTLSMIFFIYAILLSLHLSIIVMNIQPLKVVSRYPSTTQPCIHCCYCTILQ